MRPASAATGTPAACARSTSQGGGVPSADAISATRCSKRHVDQRRHAVGVDADARGAPLGRAGLSPAAPGRRSGRGGRRSTRGAPRAAARPGRVASRPPVSDPTYLRGISRSTPNGRPLVCSRIHVRSTSSCSGRVGDGAEDAEAAGVADRRDHVAAVGEGEDGEIDPQHGAGSRVHLGVKRAERPAGVEDPGAAVTNRGDDTLSP